MIDLIDLEIKDFDLQKYLDNPFLQWETKIKNETAEILVHTYNFKGLFFFLDERKSKGKLRIKGSLPKFWYGSNLIDLDNYNLIQCLQACKENNLFNPDKAYLHSIEFGLNIQVPKQVPDILETFLLYGTNQFRPMRNNDCYKKFSGIECSLSQFQIKIYDKGAQIGIKENVMRIEIKVNKMQFLKRNNVNLTFLSQLADKAVLEGLKGLLLNVYDRILKISEIDQTAANENENRLLQLGNYPKFWLDLNKKSPSSFRRKRIQFLELQEQYKTNSLHTDIKEAIITKWNTLQNSVLNSEFNLSQHKICDSLFNQFVKTNAMLENIKSNQMETISKSVNKLFNSVNKGTEKGNTLELNPCNEKSKNERFFQLAFKVNTVHFIFTQITLFKTILIFLYFQVLIFNTNLRAEK